MKTAALLLSLCALCVPIAAGAEAPDSPLTEPGTHSADEGGRRAALAERGVDFGLWVYADAVTVLDGGLERRSYFPLLIEPYVALDLGKLAGWSGTHAYFRGIGMYGRDPSEGTGSLNAPSTIGNAVETWRLFEAWLEHRFLDERLSVRAGLLALDTEFDVKETVAPFLNGGFGTGVDLAQSGPNGPCIYPASCVGARLKFQPTEHTYAQFALLNGAAHDPEDPYGTHFVFNNGKYGTFTIGEAGFLRGADQGGFLHAAVGVWYWSAPFDDVRDVDAAGDPVRRHADPGFYALVEGEIYREPGSAGEGLNAFLRVGSADPDVHQTGSYLSTGLARTGLFPGRGEDVTALAVSVPVNGSKFEEAQRGAGAPSTTRSGPSSSRTSCNCARGSASTSARSTS